MTKVFENELVELHVDWWAADLTRELRKVDEDGISLGDHKCYLAIGKTERFREYVVIDGNGKPIMTAEDEMTMRLLIKGLRWEVKDKLDIRAMAQTREVPRVM